MAIPISRTAILKVNSDGSWSRIANLSAYQKLHPTKNLEPDDFEPDGTWYSLIAADGVLYAVEPNHGEVDSITPSGVVTRLVDVSETQGHVVPTSIARTASGFLVSNLEHVPDHSGQRVAVHRQYPWGHHESRPRLNNGGCGGSQRRRHVLPGTQ